VRFSVVIRASILTPISPFAGVYLMVLSRRMSSSLRNASASPVHGTSPDTLITNRSR
jgi:hypothetical protein